MSEIVTFSGKVAPKSDTELEAKDVAQFLMMVGQRVRNARQKKGMSRRVLAEKSGISQRYLAQLETGQGNISIGLLLRVAQALELGIEWLVSPDDPWHSDTARAMFLFQRANQKQRHVVLQALQPSKPSERKANRIALIGLRGAGKSTLGARLAPLLNTPFLELNHEIEQSSGMPVNEVIALYGQEGYRLLEHQAIERIVATHDALVLAVAGGIAAQADTFNYLLDHYHTVWLHAAPEDHMNRVRAQGDERPMAGNPNAMKELRRILASREEQYDRADAQVDTTNATEDQSLSELRNTIRANGFIQD